MTITTPLRRSRLLLAVALVVGNLGLTVVGQATLYRFNDVPYQFPSTAGATGTVLVNDGAGSLGWVGVGVASGVLAFSTTGSCPAGWSEYTAARGRYLVGLVAGGSNAGTVGTALTNAENRPVGQHGHLVSDPGHTHVQNAHSHATSESSHGHSIAGTSTADREAGSLSIQNPAASANTGGASTGISVASATATNQSATTGISIVNAGSVAGTNAPYVQLIACVKD